MPIFTPARVRVAGAQRAAGAAAPPLPAARRLACSRSLASTARSKSRSSVGGRAEPGDARAEAEAERGAAEHVGRVVHAEVGAADADRRGEREQVRAGPRLDAAERGGGGDRGGRVGGGEGELRRRLGQRRVLLDQRPLAADRELGDEVDPDRGGPGEPGEQPLAAAALVDRGADDADPGPDGRRTRPPCRAPRIAISTGSRGRGCAGTAAPPGRRRRARRAPGWRRRRGEQRTGPAAGQGPARSTASAARIAG